MGLRVRLSKEDIASGKLVDPGWYLCTVKDFTQGKAKGDGSDLITVKFTGAEGEAESVPFVAFFSEKFMAPWVKLLAAFGIEVQPGEDYEVESLKGQQLKLLIHNEDYNGTMRNSVKDYAPADANV